VLSRQAAEAVGMVGREKLLLCCRLFGCARRFGAHEGGDGRGHIVAAARPPTACYYYCSGTRILPVIGGVEAREPGDLELSRLSTFDAELPALLYADKFNHSLL